MSPEFRDKVKSMLIESSKLFDWDEETLAELEPYLDESFWGKELASLMRSGKNYTDEQLEAVLKTLGL